LNHHRKRSQILRRLSVLWSQQSDWNNCELRYYQLPIIQ